MCKALSNAVRPYYNKSILFISVRWNFLLVYHKRVCKKLQYRDMFRCSRLAPHHLFRLVRLITGKTWSIRVQLTKPVLPHEVFTYILTEKTMIQNTAKCFIIYSINWSVKLILHCTLTWTSVSAFTDHCVHSPSVPRPRTCHRRETFLFNECFEVVCVCYCFRSPKFEGNSHAKCHSWTFTGGSSVMLLNCWKLRVGFHFSIFPRGEHLFTFLSKLVCEFMCYDRISPRIYTKSFFFTLFKCFSCKYNFIECVSQYIIIWV